MKKKIKDLTPKDTFISYFLDDEHATLTTLLDIDDSNENFMIFVVEVEEKKMAFLVGNDILCNSVGTACYHAKDEIGNDITKYVDICIDYDDLVESVKYNLIGED